VIARTRTVPAAPATVWRLVSDPRALPRWWPRTERVENVRRDGWTTVMRTDRGRVVRADWRLDGERRGERRAWSQAVEGTPFEKVIAERRVEVRLAPAGEGTAVTLEVRQRSRKLGRLGDLVLRGPARRELDAALDRLAATLERTA
jgi:uncharacterized protein YndB with AHSA1/START domain